MLTQSVVAESGPFCQNGEDLDYLAHINTPTAARDLDLVRQLEGYEFMDYWGFSYGSVLGTTYAALFPDRVGRMILDGSLSPRGYIR
jgi:pimeloyl-ACP methyl ester carboxylesterase